MNRVLRHLALPALAPIAFFMVANMDVETLGCRNRGLLALGITLAGALAALGCTLVGTARKRRGDEDAGWWLLSSCLLMIPAIALLVIL